MGIEEVTDKEIASLESSIAKHGDDFLKLDETWRKYIKFMKEAATTATAAMPTTDDGHRNEVHFRLFGSIGYARFYHFDPKTGYIEYGLLKPAPIEGETAEARRSGRIEDAEDLRRDPMGRLCFTSDGCIAGQPDKSLHLERWPKFIHLGAIDALVRQAIGTDQNSKLPSWTPAEGWPGQNMVTRGVN